MIYLSYPLSEKTPAYAGGQGVELRHVKSLSCGDSCNQLHISMTNHIGTHVDVPSHFIEGGKTITDYLPNEWVFSRCCLIDIPCEPGQIINANAVHEAQPDIECDFLMIRTGFGKKRDETCYWQTSPVFHKDLGGYFEDQFKHLSMIGFDTISLSSMTDRIMGREAHKEILGRNIRIVEDMYLAHIVSSIDQIQAFPLLIEGADGAPVTVIHS